MPDGDICQHESPAWDVSDEAQGFQFVAGNQCANHHGEFMGGAGATV